MPEYFVGVVPQHHHEVREQLQCSPLGVSYVSYPKSLADDDLDADASSSWVYRSWPLSHFQLHVQLFEVAVSDRTVLYVFCHHEPNWLRHPVTHLQRDYLNPTWGRRRTLELLESAGLPVFACADIDDDGFGPATEYCARRGGSA